MANEDKMEKDDALIQDPTIEQKPVVRRKLVTPKDKKDVERLSDQALIDLHDGLQGMLLRNEIGEEEFRALRDLIVDELQMRGIRPLGETSRGRFSDKVLRKTILRLQDAFMSVVPGEGLTYTVNFDKVGFGQSIKDVALRISGLVDDKGELAFSSDKAGCFKPLYDLFLVPHGEEVEFARAPLRGTPEEIAYFFSLKNGSKQIFSAARYTANKGVRPGRFIRQYGSVNNLHPMEYQTAMSFPAYIVAKYSDIDVQIHKRGNRVDIWAKDGRDLSPALAPVVKVLKEDKEDYVLFGNLCMDIDGGKLATPQIEELLFYRRKQAMPLIMVYDCLYLDQDLHHLDFEERGLQLKNFYCDRNDGVTKMADVKRARSAKHVIPLVNNLRKRAGIENVCLYADEPYDLVQGEYCIRHDKFAAINTIVLDVFETSIPGIQNFVIGVEAGNMNFSAQQLVCNNEKDYVVLGETMSTTHRACPGDIVEVDARAVVHDYDEGSALHFLHAFSSRVIRKVNDRSFPFSAASVIKRALEGKVYYHKVLAKDGKASYYNTIPMDKSPQSKCEQPDDATRKSS